MGTCSLSLSQSQYAAASNQLTLICGPSLLVYLPVYGWGLARFARENL